MTEVQTHATGVWVALKKCGCCEGVAKDGYPELDDEKIQWLKDGLSVLFCSREDWKDKYLPGFLNCPHSEPGGRR